jgi:hypothetical protein
MKKSCFQSRCRYCGRIFRKRKTKLTQQQLLSLADRSCFCSDGCWREICKPRTCLKCGSVFDSMGPSNRFCKECTRVNAQVDISESELQIQRGMKRLNGITIESFPSPPHLKEVFHSCASGGNQ